MTEKKYTMRDVYQRVYADIGIVPVHAMWLDGKTFTLPLFPFQVGQKLMLYTS